jgi:hypothetical protein
MEKLIIPINVQALCVGAGLDQNNTTFVGPDMDFSKMNYSEGNKWHGKSRLSKHINPQNFDKKALDSGIHLHWTLPDALTHGYVIDNELNFPAVPNRWLITRIYEQNKELKFRAWVLESDYLSEEDYINNIKTNQTTILLENCKAKPYRYMGKLFDLKDWKEDDTSSHLDKLTAIGCGQLNFAAFYPNCNSVFGFHDIMDDVDDSSIVSYEVSGWYSDTKQDCIKITTDHFEKARKKVDEAQTQLRDAEAKNADSENKQAIVDKLAENLQEDGAHSWQLSDADQNKIEDKLTLQSDSTEGALKEIFEWDIQNPDQLVIDKEVSLYAGMVTGINWVSIDNYLPKTMQEQGSLVVVMAHTEMEAMSTFVAQLSEKNKLIAEKVLTILQASPNSLASIKEAKSSFLTEGLQNIKEMLHNDRFQPTQSGYQYTIQQQETTPENRENIKVPDEDCEKLDKLNIGVKKYQKNASTLESRRLQVFLDWYKYILTKYEDNMAGMLFPEIPNITDKEFKLEDFISEANTFIQAEVTEVNKVIAAQSDVLKDEINDTISALQKSLSGLGLELQSRLNERYYQGKDPVVLLGLTDQANWNYAGERNKSKEEYLRVRLASQIIDNPYPELTTYFDNPDIPYKEDLLKLVREFIHFSQGNDTTFDSGIQPEALAIQKWNGTPWLPLSIYWEIEIAPFVEDVDGYKTSTITDACTLTTEKMELCYRDEAYSILNKHDKTIHGTALLTPGVRDTFLDQLGNYNQGKNSMDLTDLLEKIKKIPVLSQSLNGFNEALLMQEKTYQLAPMDWKSADTDMRNWSNKTIKDAVGEMNITAPLPQNHFMPIRGGFMRLKRICLVDAFGRFQEIKDPKVAYSTTMLAPTKPPSGTLSRQDRYKAVVSPRITQPARLSFRFLSASNPDIEMQTSMINSPICGWIIPNFLDSSLMLYGEDGFLLGSLQISRDPEGIVFRPTPGSNQEATLEETISNFEFRNFATSILNKDIAYLQSFLRQIDLATDFAEPSNFRETNGIAMLVGRPLALVQANLKLQLEGLPAINQDWESFKKSVSGPQESPYKYENRNQKKLTEVQFPVLLGDKSDFEDGLIGFFQSKSKSKSKSKVEAVSYEQFYMSKGEDVKHKDIIYDTTLELTPDTEPVPTRITMLIDPRSKIHAKTGILPMKTIRLPKDQYEDKLNNMSAFFLAAPIIVNPDEIKVPIFQEDNFAWSFVTKNHQNEGSEWTTHSNVVLENQYADFEDQLKLVEGWLKLERKKA